MDSFIYQVKENKCDRSVSHSINNSFISKKGLPTLNVLERSNHKIKSNDTIDNISNIIQIVDNMNNNMNNDEVSSIIENIDDNELNIFKENVKNWLELNKQIMNFKTEINKLEISRKKIDILIKNFMIKYKLDDLNTDKGKIKHEKKKSKSGFTKKNVTNVINNYFDNDIESAKKLLGEIDKIINVKENSKLVQILE